MEYQSKLKDEQVDMLFESILCLEDQEECYRFFEDLCTINEIKSLAQRLEVAIMLRKKTYLSGDCGKDRCQHCYHKQGESLPIIWFGWL